MRRWMITACLSWLISPVVDADVGVRLSLERKEYLLYEPLDIQVRVSNYSSETLDMARMAEETPWLDFFVMTPQSERISLSKKPWNPPNLILLPGEVKSISINLMPYFLLRDSGDYQVMAQVMKKGQPVSTSSTIKFTIMKGTTIWQQPYAAPANPDAASKTSRPRLYSLIIHRIDRDQILYAQILNPAENHVLCITPLGNLINFGEPQTRIDLQGNLHVFHQSGVRLFTYTRFSADGKWLGTRQFSNIGSAPAMVAGKNNETNIIGGEEVFEGPNRTLQPVPTPPLVKSPEK